MVIRHLITIINRKKAEQLANIFAKSNYFHSKFFVPVFRTRTICTTRIIGRATQINGIVPQKF